MIAKSFCRMCAGFCGVDLDIEDGRVVRVRGDHDHPTTRGYACIKGLNAPDQHYGPSRLLHPLKRVGRDFHEIPLETALEEIAERLEMIRAEDGPQSIATYAGTGTLGTTTASGMRKAFEAALGCQAYTTMTIDQSAKWASMERLGTWAAGKHPFELADVWLVIGLNPLVSIWGWTFPVQNPLKQLRDAKARGTKLIVIDPRRSEFAALADVHLQIDPGEDAAVAAGLLHIIFANGWENAEFCEQHVTGLAELREAVAPFTPEVVAQRAGVKPQELIDIARAFAHARKAGVQTGTGPNMAPFCNLSEQLYDTIAVVCGQFPQAGDPVTYPPMTIAPRLNRAEAISPQRGYLKLPRTRVRGAARMMGETPAATIVEEILTPGDGRTRALIVTGSNPVGTIPDQNKVVGAFQQLDLLVAVEPTMSATANLAHYILPPKLMYERPDITIAADGTIMMSGGGMPVPFAQFSDAIVPPPAGSEVCDEYRVWWDLGRRLGLQLEFRGTKLDMDELPDERDLLKWAIEGGAAKYDDLVAANGALTLDLPRPVAGPAGPEAGRFEVMSDDVRAEMTAMQNTSPQNAADQYPFKMISRRVREVLNSAYREFPAIYARMPYNPLRMHPADMKAMALRDGDHVRITSDNAEIPGIVSADDSLKRGTVSMSHGFGALPGQVEPYEKVGASTSLLISIDRDCEPLQSMPRMSAIPVRIERADMPAAAEAV